MVHQEILHDSLSLKALFLVAICFVYYGCSNTENLQTLESSDSHLKLNNGVLYYNTTPFSGHLISYYPNGNIKSEIQYYKGKKHGYEKHWFANSILSIERYYTKGLKTQVHKGWWSKDVLKFEYYFNNKGEHHGSAKEWYKDGKLFKHFNYKNGKETGHQRLWKINGAIKANYKVINGERFGLIGLKKCYTVTKEANELHE